MRKLLILAVIVFGAYKSYAYYQQSSIAVFDENGKPQTLVFTVNSCPPCQAEIKLLKQRKIAYTEYNISDSTDNQKLMRHYGGNRQLPFTVSGNRTTAGFQADDFTGFLAEVYGSDVLTRYEKKLMSNNFAEDGSPLVVMYSTQACGYCKQAAQYLNSQGVAFVERDIERDYSAKRDYQALKGSGTPLIYVGYRRIAGFNKKHLSELISEL